MARLGFISMAAAGPLLAFVGAAGANAQPAPPSVSAARTDVTAGDAIELDEVIVLSRKREERLLDVPESITALSEGALERAGVATLNDLGRQTPNIALNRRQDNEPNVVIRGVGAFGNTQGVGFYVDDVQNFTDQSMRLEDLAGVEILKGPQGTLYGGSNIGGAVKYISKQPAFDTTGEVAGEIGGFGHQLGFAAINVPLVADMLAMRVSAFNEHNDGFVRNQALNVDADRGNERGLRTSFLFKPGANFDALLTLRYGFLHNGGNPYTLANSHTDYRRYNMLSEDAWNERETWGAVLQSNYDLGPAKLTSITSYTRREGKVYFDADYSPLRLLYGYTRGDSRPGEVYTQELRLTSPSGGAFDWIAGLYASRVDNLSPNKGDFFIAGPILGLPFDLLLQPASDFNTHATNLAAFGTANYRIGDWTLGGGLRLSRTEYAGYVTSGGGAPVGAGASVEDTILLPKLSLSYKLANGTLLYASVAEGYEPGKVNVNITPPISAPPTYKAETAWNYEVGAKGLAFDRKLEFQVAAFYIDYRDRQFETRRTDPIFGVIEVIDNIGDSTSKGVEGSLTWRATRQLTVSAAVGYLDSTWDDAVFNEVSIAGKRVPNAPKVTANLGLGYTRPLFNDLTLDLHADASYTGDFYWDLYNTPKSGKQPGYWLANARIAIGAASGPGWQFAVRGENLLNQKYLTEFYPEFFFPQDLDGTCVECHLAAPGQPRRVVATLSYRF